MRTDVYALGLVLYEMFTGEPAFKMGPADLFTRGAALSLPTRPSTLIPDIDPAIEQVILQCIERDPTRRPPSAIAVAVALPGGDPLAAALAAGDTPSPEMVAGQAGSARFHQSWGWPVWPRSCSASSPSSGCHHRRP